MHDHDADDTLLGMFRQLGVSFEKPREINFYFVFPSESDANNAQQAIRQKKLEAEVFKLDVPWWKRLFTKPEWSVSVTREMPLDEAKIKKITTLFQQIASTCNGTYDGWEASVMDDQIDAEQLQNLQ